MNEWTELLNLNQSPEQLEQIYQDDYYWYLSSEPFRETFLRPMGALIDHRIGFNGRCLDLGCGQAVLSEYVRCRYVGMDGSIEAIRKGQNSYPTKRLFCGRFERDSDVREALSSFGGKCDVVVIGNLLHVLVKPEKRVDFLEQYLRYDPQFFVIYDVQELDCKPLEERFNLHVELRGTVQLDGIPEIKKRRKVLVLSCN